MRRVLQPVLAILLASSAIVVSAAEGVRNPFWPKGYVGELVPISADVRKRPKPKPKPEPAASAKTAVRSVATSKTAAGRDAAAKAKAVKEVSGTEAAGKAAKELAARAEAGRKRDISSEDWKKAMRSLKIGNPASFTGQDGRTRSTISINGNIYGDGDFISTTHDGIRFTWRVKGLDGGEKLRLDRIRARRVK